MSRPTPRRIAAALVACAATAAVLQGTAGTAAAAGVHGHHGSTVGAVEQHTARTLAASLADADWRAELRSAALSGDAVDLPQLTAHATADAGHALRSAVHRADRRIATAKGLSPDIGSLLRLRLGADAMRDGLASGTTPWVTAATTDDGAQTVTAYDSRGRTHVLSTSDAPQHPVYVIDIDAAKATAAGMKVLDHTLAAAGLNTPARPGADDARSAAGGFSTTKLDAVRLSDDEEPWVEGDAEIFSLVSGFGPAGVVQVDSVDMPYLDEDDRTYYPNQILVNWSHFKYDAADVVMMEDDGDTNYAALAKAVADALLTITDQGAYVPLVNAVLDAIPTAWWTNDPDYADSWYTLTTGSSGTLNGARGNGWINVSPYWVSGL